MNIQELLSKVKYSLKELYKDNLIEIILYGSYARQNSNTDSDVDILVVLKKLESVGKEIDRIVDVTYDIALEYNTLISVVPISYDDYKNINSPLLLNVRREGVTVE